MLWLVHKLVDYFLYFIGSAVSLTILLAEWAGFQSSFVLLRIGTTSMVRRRLKHRYIMNKLLILWFVHKFVDYFFVLHR